jgi:hypothetical protein
MFKIGDKVKLITDSHGLGKSNPYWPEYKIIGTITHIYESSMPIRVVWSDDGYYHNVYYEYDLELVNAIPIIDVDELFEEIEL